MRKQWQRGLKGAVQLFVLVSGVVLVVGVGAAWVPMGKTAEGARLERMSASPQWQEGHFENPQPMWNDVVGSITGVFGTSPYVSPTEVMGLSPVDPGVFKTPPQTGLRVTWLGHSTMLVEIDGVKVLTDPMWGERASPVEWVGPRRWYEPLLPLQQVPPIDVVVISHDHFDHLNYPTLSAMKDWNTQFVVPLGIGAHLAYWGIPEAKIHEVDWWERVVVGEIEVVSTPARHASGRMGWDYGATLWSGYALIGAKHRVYYSGDTGLFPAMTDIGERLGPFDLTLIEAGQYGAAWPDWHLGPEQAVKAHQMVKGKVMMPIHWALFALAFHGWTEPPERVLVAAQAAGVTTLIPPPGQSVEPENPPPPTRWWPSLPWNTADQDPIIARGIDP